MFGWIDYGSQPGVVRNNQRRRSHLADVIDKTISPMGARMLKRWVAFPLKDVKPINERLSVVEHFFKKPDLKLLLEQNVNLIGDLERIISKVAVGRAIIHAKWFN